jgi:phosphate transport system permease protein
LRPLRHLHSLPKYYGYYVAIWCGMPALLLLGFWLSFSDALIVDRVIASLPEGLRSLPEAELSLVVNDIKNMAAGQFVNPARKDELAASVELYLSLQQSARWILSGLLVALAFIGFGIAWSRVRPQMRARNHVEGVILFGLILASSVAIFTTAGILLSVLFESLRFFQRIPVTDFLFGLNWSPQIALRADQVGASGAFGAIPLFTGTLLISAIAMLVAVPVGLMSAIYLSEYAPRACAPGAKPVLEILAGIPTVVYGFFAALTVAPLMRDLASLGLDVASESALAAGMVMGVMIIPFVSSLSDDVINAVPQSCATAPTPWARPSPRPSSR